MHFIKKNIFKINSIVEYMQIVCIYTSISICKKKYDQSVSLKLK